MGVGQLAIALRTKYRTALIGRGPRGEKGDPGGNIMAIGLFADASGLSIPAGTDAVRTSGHTTIGKGVADYVFDAAVDSAYVAANPRSSFISTNGRGFRLSVAQRIDVTMFGALGDGVSSDADAFVAAIALLKSIAGNVSANGFYKASPTLFVPAGNYLLGSTTLDITHTLIIEGEGMGHWGPSPASQLTWNANTTGIRIQMHNTSGASTVDATTHFAGAGTILRQIALVGAGGAEGEYHGIHAKGRFTAEHVFVANFQGDGLHIDATSLSGGASEGNANLFRVRDSAFVGCRDGISVKGGDANAGSVMAVDCSSNRRWGISDQSFLGNTYDACHTSSNGWNGSASPYAWCSYNGYRYAVVDGQEAGASTNAPSGDTTDNTWWYFIGAGPTNLPLGIVAWTSGLSWRAGGAYRTNNVNGRNVFTGCYSESDQPASQMVHPSLVLGGLHSAAVKGTAGYIRVTSDGIVMDNVSIATAGIAEGIVSERLSQVNAAPLVFYSAFFGGNSYSIYSDATGLHIDAIDGGAGISTNSAINSGAGYKVGGVQVVGGQQVKPGTPTLADVVACLSAHGLWA